MKSYKKQNLQHEIPVLCKFWQGELAGTFWQTSFPVCRTEGGGGGGGGGGM